MTKVQLDKFKAAAKAAECDLDEAKFDEVLEKLAKSEEGQSQPSPSGRDLDTD